MFGFSGGEVLLIALIALVLFGNEKLPENIKKMVKGLNQAKKVARDVQSSWQEVKSDVQRSINFDDEKQEILSLVEPISIDDNEFKSNKITPTPSVDSVPQQEIDDFYAKNPNLGSEGYEGISLQELNLEGSSLSYEKIRFSS